MKNSNDTMHHTIPSLIQMIEAAVELSKDDRCCTHLISVTSDTDVI